MEDVDHAAGAVDLDQVASPITRVALAARVTAGRPYSRATPAAWLATPPTSVTRPKITETAASSQGRPRW